ncbi:hypothetical protein CYR55_14750 [Chimaeribacter californicus]|uniref:Uncharacterized protein n=1 Tax=Chimaeribacter californicus TaxID=2060067 RepID=A0A2N5E269_9GAMM|nr:hypothetical protein [Chimaeribacter californicus]PLR34658.1 hypothetical protein CYR55_14750 [Chimaeribacter californicus]
MVLQQKVSPHSTPSPVFEGWGPVMAYTRYDSSGWSEVYTANSPALSELLANTLGMIQAGHADALTAPWLRHVDLDMGK